MATTAQYLEQLQADKQTLVDNLVAKGVEATNDETFTSLVPKVANIQSGGSETDEYWDLTTKTSGDIRTYIKKIPMIDTSQYSSMTSFLGSFSRLEEVPLLNTSNATNMQAIFSGCSLLTTIPLLDTSNVTNVSSMFYDCFGLTHIPQLNTSKATTMATMFYRCRALTTVPLLDASNVTNVASMFIQCNELTDLGGLKDLGKAYLTTVSANYNNYALILSNSNKLTHDSLMNVINNLYDIASAGVQPQKLQLGSTLLSELSDSEKAIATNKGWTLS